MISILIVEEIMIEIKTQPRLFLDDKKYFLDTLLDKKHFNWKEVEWFYKSYCK
jgi:hypothetical protein